MTVTLEPAPLIAPATTPPRSRTQLAVELLDRAHVRGDLVTADVLSSAICAHRAHTALLCASGSATEHVLNVDDDPSLPGSYVPATTRGVITARRAAGLALADLLHGKTIASDIALHLNGLGVRAVCGDTVGCAIAVFLLQRLNVNYSVNGSTVQPAAVTQSLAWRLSDQRMSALDFSRMLLLDVPTVLHQFIGRFDNGAYPSLHRGCDVNSCDARSSL